MNKLVDPGEAEAAERALVGWLEGLRLGDARQRAGLALAPVYHDRPAPGASYVTLPDALAAGDALITEQPHASVPTLRVQNLSALPILILDGEEVVGGKQNRVVNTTLLVPPRSVFDLPVSCVEHGRWNDASPTFQVGEAAYPTLRRQKMAQVAASVAAEGEHRADQGAIWDEIAGRHAREGIASPTGAMRDAYRGGADDLEDAERALPCPPDDPVGVVALVGGRAHCADLFDHPTTLRGYWPRLVRSYALEAADAQPNEPSAASAQRLLRRPLQARRTVHPSAGLGCEVRLAGNGVVGAALVWADAIVHLALFRQARPRAERTPIRRPSERRAYYE